MTSATTKKTASQKAMFDSAEAAPQPVDLVLADKALLSLRASGHDYCSAIGEVFDNSIQANANNIRLKLFTDKRVVGKNAKKTEVVERVAIGDDGDGMSADVLHRALQLGYSSRYDDRTGMGRFGVGAKLGGISIARRLEIWSRKSASDPWLYTYIDLDEIEGQSMSVIPQPVANKLPDDCVDLVGEHGTLVVWSHADRLAMRETGGARQASTVETELTNYTAQTFRKFLDGGIQIFIGKRAVKPHDPLYLMTSTRFHAGENPDPTATIVVDDEFEWPIPRDPDRTATVKVRMTLLPEAFRKRRGDGGSDIAKDRRIDDNEGISILRAGREIFFGYLRGVQPSVEKVLIDRFWGAEITFSPELDECFHVRNVKKGAEPLNGLRDKLKEYVWKSVETLRKQIRHTFDSTESAEQKERGVHNEAEDVAAKTKDLSPKPRAGHDTPKEEKDRKIKEAARKLTEKTPERADEVEEEIRQRPFTLLAEGFPGSEMFDIDHLGDNAIVKLNMRHPFYRDIYAPLVAKVEATASKSEDADERSLARLAQVGLDILILAYARAEGMRSNATEHYADLRTSWGLHLKNMIQEWKK
ncbi:MAG: ATP-binding protein [Planctomycetaceae bacterium]